MIKRALKFAVGPGIGVMIGAVAIPRLTRPHLYNETYPSFFLQADLSLVAGYAGSALVIFCRSKAHYKFREILDCNVFVNLLYFLKRTVGYMMIVEKFSKEFETPAPAGKAGFVNRVKI